MNFRFLVLSIGAAVVLGALPAVAGQINFDDLPAVTDGTVPSTYDGFTWGPGWLTYDQADYDSDYSNTVAFPSAPNAGYNSGGTTEIDLFASTPTAFSDAQFATWADENEPFDGSSTVTVQGWNGATLEWSASEDLGVDFTDLTFGSAPVTELKFLNDGSSGQWMLVDNINYSSANAVPEPITLSLFGAGLAGAVAMRRRKKNDKAKA